MTRAPMSIDKTKPVIRWAILRMENNLVDLIEVEDVMRCIVAPGDFGWVKPVDKESRLDRWIADFEQIYESRDAAKAGWIIILQERIAKSESDLAHARSLRSEHCHLCGALNLDNGECSNTVCVRY